MMRWICGNTSLLLDRPLVMGILNVTPDSFSDGGVHFSPEDAVEAALAMQRDGADILDIGAQSSRPGHEEISAQEEIRRLAPVLNGLKGKLRIPLSIDTFVPEVAEFALQHGACILNDVTGFDDPQMRALAAKTGCGCVVVHHEAIPPDVDPPAAVRNWCAQKAAELADSGIAAGQICFDPGIGFSKNYGQDLALIGSHNAKLPGFPWLVGASRKRVIGQSSGEENPARRDPASIAAHTLALAAGAAILRVHHVPDAVQAAKTTAAILAAIFAKKREAVHINGLRLFGFHGVNPEEKEQGQDFVLDIDLHLDLEPASQSDRLQDTVNYAAAVKTVRAAFLAQKYDLIEKAAGMVADALLAEYPAVLQVAVTVKKPHAPVNADFDYMAVTLVRDRHA